MLASKMYCPTLREIPAGAEVVSHQYMLKAGMIRKNSSGVYTLLPMGWRVVKKIEAIIREEMENAGAQELMMPIVQPAEIWRESGRWDVYGEEMFKLKDRHGNEYCLAPTHEELITTLVRNELRSYKQLPVNLYQIQNKYRDEIRPRFGLMRGREFIMEDGYSFDADEEGLKKNYELMYNAYVRVFDRCGLDYRPVQADSGQIGGSRTHEFMALAASGEADVVHCTKCDFAANVEKVEPHALEIADEEMAEMALIETRDCKTIEDLHKLMNMPAEKTLKSVAFNVDGKLVLCVVRGDHEVNDVAVQKFVGGMNIEAADEELLRANGLVPGYMSPIGSEKRDKEKFIIIVDKTAMQVKNGVTGANKDGYHYKNVNPVRDFKNVRIETIRLINADDVCPVCGAPIKIVQGIEVGQVFELGTKYSKALGATFLDKNGKAQPFVMGCYGIGVTRTMAAAIEQSHDENGIIWPVSIAPYEVDIVPINEDAAMMAIAGEIYARLRGANIDTMLDDRKERAGVKFNDADLIGYPLRITIGKKTLQEGTIEIKVRKTGQVVTVLKEETVSQCQALLSKLR